MEAFERMGIVPNRDFSKKSILITGGSGGTGHFAVQIAKLRGFTLVMVTARSVLILIYF